MASGQQCNQALDHAPDSWDRAVFKSAPPQFWFETISMAKLGGTLYGLRICPIRSDSSSFSSKASSRDYVIWRTWEDCLWLQEGLESEYKRMAREKRNRLVAGKGVKKNGMYIHDRAASFESLPPGPDPNSIPRDVHHFLPKLTKKSTFFRPSATTISQRIEELHDLICALLSNEVPALIKELREERKISDFFGVWRRDHELAEKERMDKKKDKSPAHPRQSITSSVFSMYFPSSPSASDLSTSDLSMSSSSIPSVPSIPQRFFHVPDDLPRPVSLSTISSASAPPSANAMYFQHPPHSDSNENLSISTITKSPQSSPAPSSSGSRESLAVPSPVMTAHEVPLIFEHNPEEHLIHPRWSGLAPLPEETELRMSISSMDFAIEGKGDGAVLLSSHEVDSIEDGQTNGDAGAYLSPPSPPHSPLDVNGTEGDIDAERYSWQSTASTDSTDSSATYLRNLSLVLPPTPFDQSHASMTSFLTTSSADAIIPKTTPVSNRLPPSVSLPGFPERTQPSSEDLTFSEENPNSLGNEHIYDSSLNLIPSSPMHPLPERHFKQTVKPTSPVRPHIRTSPLTKVDEFPEDVSPVFPETPTEFTVSRSSLESARPAFMSHRLASRGTRRPSTADPTTSRSLKESAASVFSHLRLSRATRSPQTEHASTTSSASPTSPTSDESSITIKAAYNKAIVVMRLPRDISFTDLRQRIQQKFVTQEGLPLSNSFTMAYVLPLPAAPPTDDADPNEPRSPTLSILSTPGIPDIKKVKFLTSPTEWLNVSTGKDKMTIRIIDTIS